MSKQNNGIESTWPARDDFLKGKVRPIPSSAYSKQIIPDGATSLGWMFGQGANYRPSALACDALNRAFGFKSILSGARMREVITWLVKAPNPELLAGHYGFHALEIPQTLREACRKIGWNDLAEALQTLLDEELCLLACFTYAAPAGEIRPDDNALGPRVLRADQPSSPKYPTPTTATIGPRGDRANTGKNGTYWMAFPLAWCTSQMASVDLGRPHHDDSTSQELAGAGMDGSLASPEVAALIRKAIRNDPDALAACWERGKARLNGSFSFELTRRTDGLTARHLDEPSHLTSNMKGPRPAVVFLGKPTDNWLKVYAIAGRGGAWWYGYNTREVNGQIIVDFPEVPATLSTTAPKGDVLFRVLVDAGKVVDEPKPNPEPPPIPDPSPEPTPEPTPDEPPSLWEQVQSWARAAWHAIRGFVADW